MLIYSVKLAIDITLHYITTRPLKGQFVIPMLKQHMANQCTKLWTLAVQLLSPKTRGSLIQI